MTDSCSYSSTYTSTRTSSPAAAMSSVVSVVPHQGQVTVTYRAGD